MLIRGFLFLRCSTRASKFKPVMNTSLPLHVHCGSDVHISTQVSSIHPIMYNKETITFFPPFRIRVFFVEVSFRRRQARPYLHPMPLLYPLPQRLGH